MISLIDTYVQPIQTSSSVFDLKLRSYIAYEIILFDLLDMCMCVSIHTMQLEVVITFQP